MKVIPFKDLGINSDEKAHVGNVWELMKNASVEDMIAISSYYDEDFPELMFTYNYIHHDISSKFAIWKSVMSNMYDVLHKYKWDNKIKDSDRKAIYTHLAGHYKQFKKEVPDYKIRVMKSSIPYADLGIDTEAISYDVIKEVKGADDRTEIYKRISAWGNEDEFRLAHHKSSDFKSVFAGVKESMKGLLNGEAEIPEEDEKEVWNHLSKHYEEHNKKAPELKTYTKEEIEEVFKIDEDEETKTSLYIPIAKVDKAKQLIYGIVYEPDTVDAQGDFAKAEEIEKAAHWFMENNQNVSLMHKELINDSANIVENYIAPVDFTLGSRTVKKGAWVMTTHILDKKLWKKVEDGEINGYSLEGMAKSVPQEE